MDFANEIYLIARHLPVVNYHQLRFAIQRNLPQIPRLTFEAYKESSIQILEDRLFSLHSEHLCLEAFNFVIKNGHVDQYERMAAKFDVVKKMKALEFRFTAKLHPRILQLILQDTIDLLELYSKVDIFRYAITFNYVETVEFLLQYVNPSIDRNYALIHASQLNRHRIIRLMLDDERIDPAMDDCYAFRIAVDENNTETVKTFLNDPRIDPAAANNYAFKCSIEENKLDILKLLVEKGVSPSVENNYGIFNSCSMGHTSIVEYLLSLDVQPTGDCIYEAATNGHFKVVELLLQKGLRPAQDCLSSASFHGHSKIVELLLPFNDPSVDNQKALVYAIKSGSHSVVRILLKDPRISPLNLGQSILEEASENPQICKLFVLDDRIDFTKCGDLMFTKMSEFNNLHIMKLLIDKGIDPAAMDNKALLLSCKKNHLEICKWLLGNESVKQAQVLPSLTVAAELGYDRIVDLILNETRLDPSLNGQLLLRKACSKGHLQVVERLLQDKRVDPSVFNNLPLRLASHGHVDVVKVLMSDYRTNPADDDNYALRTACKNGFASIVKLLLQDSRVDPNVEMYYPLRISLQYQYYEITKIIIDCDRFDFQNCISILPEKFKRECSQLKND
ncbi:hypothetical protein HK103_000817 [Boothiomyces macroporosus]|uniref:Ankyrin repeat protein n=1 Tax=Boothiomyces macroporosus TaxID=261099 RepID=A0AAD5Y5N0_9FUNG|nr:hypothetical protein HK103_000817 [Boothiomyces macroporosus]